MDFEICFQIPSLPAGLVCMQVSVVTNITGQISSLSEYTYAGLTVWLNWLDRNTMFHVWKGEHSSAVIYQELWLKDKIIKLMD